MVEENEVTTPTSHSDPSAPEKAVSGGSGVFFIIEYTQYDDGSVSSAARLSKVDDCAGYLDALLKFKKENQYDRLPFDVLMVRDDHAIIYPKGV